MTIHFLRVLSTRTKTPTVLARVDGLLVKWHPRKGWYCECADLWEHDCDHIDAVEDLLDPRVIIDESGTA